MVELSPEKIISVVIWSCVGVSLLILFLAWTVYRYYQAMVKKKQDLINTMIETQEKERLRIARDMHDNFGNIFTIIQLEISTLNKIDDIDRMQTSFNCLLENIEKANNELRYNVTQLAPGNLKTLDWIQELINFKEKLKHTNIEITNEILGNVVVLSQLNQTNLFRICQELINNAIKYAMAAKISFCVIFTATHIEIQYTDDGIGFNLNEKIKKGFGLRSIQARTDAMQGKCQCISSPDKGTRWNFSFPVKSLTEHISL